MIKHSILIVDDEPILRDSLRDWLEEAGYEVSLAVDGEEALKKLKMQNFNFVIIDYGLPGMNGISLLQRVNALNLSAKCIIITANPSVELAVEAMKRGAIDFLIKPIVPEKLEKLVHEALSGCGIK